MHISRPLLAFFQCFYNYFFPLCIGNINYPPEENDEDSSVVTILKLADQEILDIVKYFALNDNSSDSLTTSTSTTTVSPEYGNIGCQVFKGGILNYKEV